MGALLLSARLLLAGVFGLAAVAKSRDRARAKQAGIDLGLPSFAVPFIAFLLPILEAVTAAALIPQATAWFAALAALALLFAFTLVILRALLRGRRVACHCFGQVSSKPIGWTTLLRNGLFMATAAVIIVSGRGDPGPSAMGWIGDLTGAERVSIGMAALAFVATAALGWILYEVSRGYGRVLLRLEKLEERVSAIPSISQARGQPSAPPPPPRLPIGTPIPSFALTTLDGSHRTMRELLDVKRTTMLVFMDPHCGPCTLMLPEITDWMAKHTDALNIWVVSRGEPKPNRKKFAERFHSRLLLLEDLQLAQYLGTLPTPSALLVRPDGRIGSAPAIGPDPIRTLVASRTKRAADGSINPRTDGGLRIGSPAPVFRLRDLQGILVDSTKLGRRETLLLFWNPACGFCKKMVPDLIAWEEKADPAAPHLLLISTGTLEENRALGLSSRIVLDTGHFSVGQAYGCTGTPSAVLLDRRGLIASDVVVGADAVLGLAAPVTASQEITQEPS